MSQRSLLHNWDDAFANMAHIENSATLPEQWQTAARAYRESGVLIKEHAYGEQARERFDLIWPNSDTARSQPRGLVVFVHGGYWMGLDKSFWTHLAEGARQQGWVVCVPSYTLTPDVRIAQITRQIGTAITAAASLVAGPIRLAGHSAGGHLVTRMLCDDTPLSADTMKRIEHTVSISGLHDLRPLLKTAMNDTLRLDMQEASKESAVLHLPESNAHLTAWVGGGERPEFIRQAKLIAGMWFGLDAQVECIVDGEHDHFSVIEGLGLPNSEITQALLTT